MPRSILSLAAYKKYQAATGGQFDKAAGLLKITPAQFSALKPLDFQIGGTTYSLVPDAQIWPRSLNFAINGDKDSIYLVVQDFGAVGGGPGFDFVNGFAFLYVLLSNVSSFFPVVALD